MGELTNTTSARLPWFRFYSEAVHDPKVQRLPAKLFKFWVNVLCLCAENDGELPKYQDVAWATRIPADECLKSLKELKDAGLIDDYGSHMGPHNWNGRQFKSDNSTERVKRYRERSKTVTVTPSDTDTDTEQKQNGAPRFTVVSDVRFETLYERHIRKKDRSASQRTFSSIMAGSTDPMKLFAEIDRVHSMWCATFNWNEQSGRFCPSLWKWLEDRGWTTEPKMQISKEEYDLDEYDRRMGKI